MASVSITFEEQEIVHLREMGRQQLLADYETIIDCLDGREDSWLADEAGERFLFTSRLLRRLQVQP